MRVRVKSLGPIREGADIELGDLTVFFGPQNTGKSTVMKAIYYSLSPPITGPTYEKGTVALGPLILAYISPGKEVEFRVSLNKDYVKPLLPDGEFEVEPSLLTFMEGSSVYDRYEDRLDPFPLTLPAECEAEIKKTVRKTFGEGVTFRAEVMGSSGKVTIELDGEGVSPSCKEALYKEITKKALERVASRILTLQMEKFKELLRGRDGIEGVVYIPYWRSFVLSEAVKLLNYRAQSKGTFSSIFDSIAYSFARAVVEASLYSFYDLHSLFKRASEASINERVYRLVKLLVPGDLVKTSEGQLAYVEGGKPIPWDFVSASIAELLTLPLSVREKELVLYEEPETQLHERSQVVMALILYALTNTNRLVITTHSQTILYTLAYMALTRPTADDVKEFLNSIGVNGGEELANLVGSASSKTVKFYYFHDGKVEEVEAKKVIEGIPGVADVMHEEFRWLSGLYWRKRIDAGAD